MTSRQLAELVRRAAVASAERAAPVEAPAQIAVAGKVIEPPVPAPRLRAAHQPIAGTLRLSRLEAGSVEAHPSLQRPTLPPQASAAVALTAEERRERRDRKLARRGLTKADINALTWRLMERWPAVFGEHRRALAVGIHHVILAEMPDCDRVALSFALREWCSHPAYLRAVEKGRHRHSLTGGDVAELTEAEKAAAWRELQELRQQRTAHRAAASVSQAEAVARPACQDEDAAAPDEGRALR